THQSDQHAMLWRELVKPAQNLGESEPALRDPTPVAVCQIADHIDIDGLTPIPFRTLAIEPKVLRDAKHPTVQMRAGLPLVPASQSARAGLLHEVVTLVSVAG